MNRWDVFGQYSPREHERLTAQSFNRYVDNSGNGFWTPGCRHWALRRLQTANTGQDTWSAFKSEVHFNRAGGNETAEQRDAARRASRVAYEEYISSELAKFHAALSGQKKKRKKPDCAGALDALGKVTHSWQDFFAHAVHETRGFSGSPYPFPNTPWNPGRYWPSSWPGEHPLRAEPVPAGTPEYAARYDAAVDFVWFRYLETLSIWIELCWCECGQ